MALIPPRSSRRPLGRRFFCFFISISVLSVFIVFPPLNQTILHSTQPQKLPILPPRVDILLEHVPPRNVSVPDWTTPTTIAAHVRHLRKDKSVLTILTTGTDAAWFQRGLKHVGCAIGDSFHHSVMVQPEMVKCLINASAQIDGQRVTALIKWDESFERASNKSMFVNGVTFEISDKDVTKSSKPFEKPMFNRPPPSVGPVAVIKSDIKWTPNLIDNAQPAAPKYELCLMTQIKYDAHLLPEWLKYYRRMGVDQFYLYDNNSPHGLDQYASDYVEIIRWPWNRSQFQSFTHFLLASRSRCLYAAYFDLDEYVFVGGSGSNLLKRYLFHRTQQGYGQVLFKQIMMAGEGIVLKPKGSLPEIYTHVKEYQNGFGTKTVVMTNGSYTSHRVSRVFGEWRNVYANYSWEMNPTTFEHAAIVIHFVSRSWEEFVEKAREGNSNILLKYFYNAALKVNNPQSWFLSMEHRWQMLDFRDFYRRFSSLPDHGDIVLTWNRDADRCRRVYCPTCLFEKVSRKTCGLDELIMKKVGPS